MIRGPKCPVLKGGTAVQSEGAPYGSTTESGGYGFLPRIARARRAFPGHVSGHFQQVYASPSRFHRDPVLSGGRVENHLAVRDPGGRREKIAT